MFIFKCICQQNNQPTIVETRFQTEAVMYRQRVKRSEESAVNGRKKNKKNSAVNIIGFSKTWESLQPLEVLEHTVKYVHKNY